MMRFMKEADVILEEVATGTLHFYFFGNDTLGAACYNFRPHDPAESSIEYEPEEYLREEAQDLMVSGRYLTLKKEVIHESSSIS